MEYRRWRADVEAARRELAVALREPVWEDPEAARLRAMRIGDLHDLLADRLASAPEGGWFVWMWVTRGSLALLIGLTVTLFVMGMMVGWGLGG